MARVLKPGSQLKGSVPDLNILFRLFLSKADQPGEQVKILHMIYGGHIDEFDIHHFGYNFTIMAAFLAGAGFTRIDQVELLNEFSDTSFHRHEGGTDQPEFYRHKVNKNLQCVSHANAALAK